jgi:hypothetical protein
MLIQGSPIALSAPQDSEMKDRFWYWQGTSGRKYIHSVYDIDSCPPLPGAVYVAVKRAGHLRIAVSVGRFAPFWDRTMDSRKLEELGADEIHVHLLARSPEQAESIKLDLASALEEKSQPYGFSESPGSWVRAA